MFDRTFDSFRGVPGALYLGVQDGWKVGSTDLHDGMWHHIAVVFAEDGSPDVLDAKLYVDGMEEVYSSVQGQAINTSYHDNVLIGDNSTLIFNGAVNLNVANLTIDQGSSISADGFKNALITALN